MCFSSWLKKPASRKISICLAWPGYLRVFSSMSGASIVLMSERSPSLMNASRVPMPSNSISSRSHRAGRMTSFPALTILAGRVYSSITSAGLNTALYSQGNCLCLGRPPTMILTLSVLSSCDEAYAVSILLIPGATPMSEIAMTPFSFAKASSRKRSSGKKAISTTFLP